ncbi:MAG: class I SAM-dependent methyltransferase [Candidatus Muiribacterium halophilum]|uniref:Class I SAM-dependent methyltransferase n=1 Tax=Muiribacterium halophilum TaxID=2053465 RepID=A0A2N5Z9N7_MUIH1|nr:MAG: class I SAM-dependent methyltransferase [Candidatus Muirbacterium halophilum]
MSDVIYRDGHHYDRINEDYNMDIEFYTEECLNNGPNVLEVACGTGRLTLPIAKSGINITGIDLSDGMLEQARKKSQKAGLDINFHKCDARDFELNKKFDFIFIPFNSICHIYSGEDIYRFFNSIKKHLKDDGLFLIDVFNPAMEYLTRDSRKRFPVCEYTDPYSGDHVKVEETNFYDKESQINKVKWHFIYEDMTKNRTEPLNMRMYYPQELDNYLKFNGFKIIKKYGDFDKSEFCSQAPKQLIFCKKL